MTVIRPNSISGVTSITGQSGDISIFRADGTAADLNVNNITSGIITATHYGSGANLTSLPAANITGTLPAIDGSALTGINTAFGNSSVNTSGIITATAFIPSSGQLSNRNIIINGDFRIAQRGTSSTSTGYQTVDRFRFAFGGTDEAPTQAQVDLSSSDTPYSLGFRKSYKITNGNQTSGADAGDYIAFYTALEAQDLANSGWNYTSTSSNITLSFWAKSSVAKTFIVKFTTIDGTQQAYNHSFTLSANTWTKVTHTLPGAANI